jgi:hypothetical protein
MWNDRFSGAFWPIRIRRPGRIGAARCRGLLLSREHPLPPGGPGGSQADSSSVGQVPDASRLHLLGRPALDEQAHGVAAITKTDNGRVRRLSSAKPLGAPEAPITRQGCPNLSLCPIGFAERIAAEVIVFKMQAWSRHRQTEHHKRPKKTQKKLVRQKSFHIRVCVAHPTR